MKKFNLILLSIVLITKSLFGMNYPLTYEEMKQQYLTGHKASLDKIKNKQTRSSTPRGKTKFTALVKLTEQLIKHIKENGAENIPPALLDKIREQQTARPLTPASIIRETEFPSEMQHYEEMKKYLIGLKVPENKVDKYINDKISIHEMCFDNVDPELLREAYMLNINNEREKELNRSLLKKELKKINNEGETPLFCALKNPNINFDLISYLLTKKAPLKYPNNPIETDYNIMIENLMNNIDETGNTILHYSAGFGEITLFKFLIKYNFNINIQNDDGIRAFELLDDQGNNMLHHAVTNRDRWLISELIEIGTPIRIINQYDLIPFNLLRDEKANTILHLVVTTFNLIAIKNLIEQGSNTEIENHEGLTPLEITDCRKNTLLHYAVCVYQNLELIKFFLDLGLNPLEENIDHQTPIDLAPNEEIANLLKQSSIKTRIMSLFN